MPLGYSHFVYMEFIDNVNKHEFYIPRLNRERNLDGLEFEIKLRNELSLKSVAKICFLIVR